MNHRKVQRNKMDNLFQTQPETSKSEAADQSEDQFQDQSQEQSLEGVPEKRIEGTDKNFQSKYDKAMKELSMTKEAWEQERLESKAQFELLKRQVEELKTPPAKAELREPQRPANFNYADAMTEPESESAKYMTNLEAYRQKKDELRDQTISLLANQIQEEKRIKQMQLENERIKAETLGAFNKEGLSPEEANDLYEILRTSLTSPKIEDGAKQFTKWYKLDKTQPNKKSEQFDKRNENHQIALPPGVNAGGGLPGESESSEFIGGLGGRKKTGIYTTNKKG